MVLFFFFFDFLLLFLLICSGSLRICTNLNLFSVFFFLVFISSCPVISIWLRHNGLENGSNVSPKIKIGFQRFVFFSFYFWWFFISFDIPFASRYMCIYLGCCVTTKYSVFIFSCCCCSSSFYFVCGLPFNVFGIGGVVNVFVIVDAELCWWFSSPLFVSPSGDIVNGSAQFGRFVIIMWLDLTAIHSLRDASNHVKPSKS